MKAQGRGSDSSPRVGVIKPFFPPPKRWGMGRDPLASLILTLHYSRDLTPPMRGTKQNWNLV